jgi:hypothetical protein
MTDDDLLKEYQEIVDGISLYEALHGRFVEAPMSQYERLMVAGRKLRYRGQGIPIPTLHALCLYAAEGYDPGDFCRAALSNDLQEAVCLSDSQTLPALGAICAFIYHELPSQLHGNGETVLSWLSSNQHKHRATGGRRPAFDPRLADGCTISGLGHSGDFHQQTPPDSEISRMLAEEREHEAGHDRAEQWGREP